MKFGRKITGGRYNKSKKRKKKDRPGEIKKPKVGEEKRKNLRIRGGSKKTFLLRGKIINIQDKGKTKKVEISNVVKTPSNRFLARQNILTKGSIVETKLGNAKITNRPSQEGVINGVLIKE